MAEKRAISRKAICPPRPSAFQPPPGRAAQSGQVCTPLPGWAKSPHSHLRCWTWKPLPHPGHMMSFPPPFAPGGCLFCHCHNPCVLRLPCDWMAALALSSCSTWKPITARKPPPTFPLRDCHFPSAAILGCPFEAAVFVTGVVISRQCHTPCDLRTSIDCLAAFQAQKACPFPKRGHFVTGATILLLSYSYVISFSMKVVIQTLSFYCV